MKVKTSVNYRRSWQEQSEVAKSFTDLLVSHSKQVDKIRAHEYALARELLDPQLYTTQFDEETSIV